MTVIDEADSILEPLQHLEKNDEITHVRKLEILTEKGINLRQNFLALEEYYNLVDLIFNNRDLFAKVCTIWLELMSYRWILIQAMRNLYGKGRIGKLPKQ